MTNLRGEAIQLCKAVHWNAYNACLATVLFLDCVLLLLVVQVKWDSNTAAVIHARACQTSSDGDNKTSFDEMAFWSSKSIRLQCRSSRETITCSSLITSNNLLAFNPPSLIQCQTSKSSQRSLASSQHSTMPSHSTGPGEISDQTG